MGIVSSYVADFEQGEVPEERVSVGGPGVVLGVLPVSVAEAPARPLGGLFRCILVHV